MLHFVISISHLHAEQCSSVRGVPSENGGFSQGRLLDGVYNTLGVNGKNRRFQMLDRLLPRNSFRQLLVEMSWAIY